LRNLMTRLLHRYARWSMIYKVLVGSLITLMPPLLMTLVLGRRGRIAQFSAEELAVFGVVILGGLAYLNYVSLRILFRPLFQLMDTVSRLQEGDYRARAPVITLDRELSRVGGILNLVLDNLDRSRRYTASRIMNALERERKRIARELHDETSQALTTLIINLEVAMSSLESLDELSGSAVEKVESVVETLSGTRDLTETTLEEIRKLIFDLRPSILDDLGLVPAMRWYAMNKLEADRIDTRFDVQVEQNDRLPPDAETALFRIFQEAITNLMKHAEAGSVEVEMKMSKSAVMLRVRDDGVGFDPDDPSSAKEEGGLGLFGMHERANLLGGSCEIISAPDEGTEIRVEIARPGRDGEADPAQLSWKEE